MRTPLAILETARDEQSLLLITVEILAEVEATLLRPKFTKYLQKSGADPGAFVRRYVQLARVVTPSPVTDCPIEDPDDLKFIECAVGGGARYIVSGDHPLLTLEHYHEIQIVTPSRYLAVVAYHTGPEE
ncbi:MAG: putative toxin-antitoxin system toxin component, PIN family [Anaerolineae bacterium]|nr:putative toxin-antitoxin system toxin component, PIN family [Anaerolineae bacterium]